MLRLSQRQLDEIRKIAEQTYPHECCGILAGSWRDGAKTVRRCREAENQRLDRRANRYLIAPQEIYQLEKELRGSGDEIVGFFHSHPDVGAVPSEYDREHAWPWYSYVIVAVRQGRAGEVHSWRLSEDRMTFESEPLEVVSG